MLLLIRQQYPDFVINPVHSQSSELKCPEAAIGSLSDASRVFDADLLLHIIGDLADQLKPLDLRKGYDQIHGVLTMVDGTLLPALPKLVEAMWLDHEHKAFKIHTHFEAVKSVPVHADVTAANVGLNLPVFEVVGTMGAWHKLRRRL